MALTAGSPLPPDPHELSADRTIKSCSVSPLFHDSRFGSDSPVEIRAQSFRVAVCGVFVLVVCVLFGLVVGFGVSVPCSCAWLVSP